MKTKISPKKVLDHYDWKRYKGWFNEGCSKCEIKEGWV